MMTASFDEANGQAMHARRANLAYCVVWETCVLAAKDTHELAIAAESLLCTKVAT